MKNFFTSFFGAIVGVIVALVICTFILVGAIVGSFHEVFKSNEDNKQVKTNSILSIDFDSRIVERKNDNPFAMLKTGRIGEDPDLSLRDIIHEIKSAKTDENVKGIYLQFSNVPCGMASTEEIREALLDFKSSGKFIYAYSEVYNQKAYYLATVADKIYLNPEGGMELKGISSKLLFFKNMLNKLDVDMQIFRHGKFKSAIEPFMLDKMSEANRMQVTSFVGSVWMNVLQGISTQRKLSVEQLNAIASNLELDSPQKAVELKLVDGLKYEDEMEALLKQKIGLTEKDKLNLLSLADYQDKANTEKDVKNISKKDKVAVIYAVGEIHSGEGDNEQIGSETVAAAIKEARLDEKIKAIVFRVNSPGGSALASDVIWREVCLAKKAKPFIVSMGDVAASGGYYISCAADRIFAEPNTITGSIGVFGLLPNVQKLFADKLGINIDTVNTNKHADVGSLFRPVTEFERKYIQSGVEKVYQVFTQKVADGRKIQQAQVDSIGQGRVWSGTEALKIKLVDELGGLDKALAYAAKQAKISDYRIVSLPKQKNPLDAFLKGKTSQAEAQVLSRTLGIQYEYLKHIKNIISMKGVQARMPLDIIME